MLYIVFALKSEAQAFIDKYKLSKNKYGDLTLFENKNLKLIISGIGNENTHRATSILIEKFALSENDIFLNIGICGANKKYTIGELLEISSIVYKDQKYIINNNNLHIITCVDKEISEDLYEIADMESFGFYKATKEIKNRHIFKIVSDHFEPSKITKDGTKKVIFDNIDEIMYRINIYEKSGSNWC